MGFYTAYKAVFDSVRAQIEKKSTIKTVILGEQFSLGNLPKAIINAEASPVSQATLGSLLQVRVNFSVVLVVLEYEPKDWFTDVIKVMADVLDAVLADRSLGGKAKDCIPLGFAPGEIKFQDKLLFGGVVRFEALLLYKAS